jgi:hypothetical protein
MACHCQAMKKEKGGSLKDMKQQIQKKCNGAKLKKGAAIDAFKKKDKGIKGKKGLLDSKQVYKA